MKKIFTTTSSSSSASKSSHHHHHHNHHSHHHHHSSQQQQQQHQHHQSGVDSGNQAMSSASNGTLSSNAALTSTTSSNYSQFIDKQFQLSKHSVCIEEVIAEGGFSIVFLVRSALNGKKYALKRMYVNNDVDLEACKLEIQICRKLSEHNRHIIKYVDSLVQRQTSDIYEILLLTKYYKLGGLVQLMNERVHSHLPEADILKIFGDVCVAVADLHAHHINHRDLKCENVLVDDLVEQTSSSSSPSSAAATSASSQSDIQSTPVTTVNPRERPKASQQLSAGVPAMPLVVLSNNANSNKHQS